MLVRSFTTSGLLALSVAVVACDESTYLRTELELDPARSSVKTIPADDANGERISIGAAMSLLTEPESDVTIESARVTISTDWETTTIVDPVVTSDDLPFEGAMGWTPLMARFEVPAPVSDDDFFRGCRAGEIDVRLWLRVDGRERGGSRTVEGSMTVPLVGIPIPPNVFGSPGIIELQETFADLSTALVPTPTGDVLATLGSNREAVVVRVDDDSVSRITEPASWLQQPLPRIASANNGDAIVGGRASPTEVGLRRFDETGQQVGSGMIEAAPWAAVEDSLHLTALGRAPTGPIAMVRSAAPLLLGDVEHPAPTEKYYGSFLVQLDDALIPTAVVPFDRDLYTWDVLEDGSVISTSTALPPTEDHSFQIERRTSTGDIVWTHPLAEADHAPHVRPLADGGVVAVYGGSYGTARVSVVRLAGTDGSEMWRHELVGQDPSIAVREGGGAIVTLLGRDASQETGRHHALLVELSATGEVVRAAPLACGGKGAVIDTADGRTLLVGAYGPLMTLGEKVLETDQQLVISFVD